MHIRLARELQGTREGEEGADLLARCVHCGFCLAACPTYQLLGDELDSPRGRLYLIKGLLEGGPVSAKTALHLDRCLTCRACESACPSGVEYAKALEIGRSLIRKRVSRPLGARLMRAALRNAACRPHVFGALTAAGRCVRPMLPSRWREKASPLPSTSGYVKSLSAATGVARRVLLLAGCVQPSLAPDIQRATTRVLGALGIDLT